MLTNYMYLPLVVYHGSIGHVTSCKNGRTPIVRFENHLLPLSDRRGAHRVHDAGFDSVKVECPPVAFETWILAQPGAVAVRLQVPLALGWGITIHRSQSLSLTEAVLDMGRRLRLGWLMRPSAGWSTRGVCP